MSLDLIHDCAVPPALVSQSYNTSMSAVLGNGDTSGRGKHPGRREQLYLFFHWTLKSLPT